MKTPMLFAFLSFTQILLITILPFASTHLVGDTCTKTLFTDFCIMALRSNPRSSTADTPTLGLIIVNKVDASPKSTLTKIEDLLSNTPDLKTKQALTSCEQSYKTIISVMVPPSKEGLVKGDYKSALGYMNGAVNSAVECEMGFGCAKSLISNLKNYEHKAASVATDVANSLL